MKKVVVTFALLGILIFCNTCYSSNSQKRFPGESYQHAITRIKESSTKKSTQYSSNTAESMKVPVNQIDHSLIPTVASYEELMSMFYWVRDNRFMYLDTYPQFSRRISWLYPDDGCFARAALAGMKLKEKQFIHPAKIFVFGDLELQTPYAPSGMVYWWYHVAEVVRYMDAYYALDPALESHHPLLLEDWFHKMGKDENLDGVICHAYTYGPLDDCFNATEESNNEAQSDQHIFLQYEWNRISRLGFDPVQILGDNPPWLQ